MQTDENSKLEEQDAEEKYEVAIEELLSTKRVSKNWFGLFGLRIVLIFVAFLVADVLVPQDYGRSPFVFFILLNIVVAQLTLICIWGTLVEGTFWVRIPWTLLLLVISWAALVFGVNLSQSFSVDPRQLLGLGLFWLFGFVASFVPLKIAAWLFGWRITQAKSLQPDPKSNRYAISDMMVGTGIFAVTMAIASALIQGELPTWSEVVQTTGLHRPEQMFALIIFSVVSLIVKLPCIWVALATPIKTLGARSITWIMLSGLIGLAEFILLTATLGLPGSLWFEVCRRLRNNPNKKTSPDRR